MGRAAVDSNQVFIDGLKVPLEDRIGDLRRVVVKLIDSVPLTLGEVAEIGFVRVKLNELGGASVSLGNNYITWQVPLDEGEDLYDLARMALNIENELSAIWPVHGETVTINRPRKIEHVEVDGAA